MSYFVPEAPAIRQAIADMFDSYKDQPEVMSVIDALRVFRAKAVNTIGYSRSGITPWMRGSAPSGWAVDRSWAAEHSELEREFWRRVCAICDTLEIQYEPRSIVLGYKSFRLPGQSQYCDYSSGYGFDLPENATGYHPILQSGYIFYRK